jgi:hypothetical protein
MRMSTESTKNKSHSCTACRKKKIQCDRTLPSCNVCTKRSLDCSYPSSESRYNVSRERSCTNCRQRRKKCDRNEPCSCCATAGLECIYTGGKTGQLNDPMSTDSPNSRQHSNDIQTFPQAGGHVDEYLQPRYSSVILGTSPISANLSELHPPLVQIWVLYQLYVENVDPLYKLFHAPSFHKDVLHAAQDITLIDAGIETLLFSVYYAAVVSLKNEECLIALKGPREHLLHR